MKKTIIIVIAVMLCSVQAFSQKGSTIWGDIFTGHVVKTDEASREITLEYAGKDGTESFVGALKEGYQVKMKDGSARVLNVSELKLGIRIRVYYKKMPKEVRGQKVTTNVISRIEFLGQDELAFMRQYLKVEPSTPVNLVESKTVPDADPLKLKVVGDNPVVNNEVIKWANDWNKREAKKYGEINVVSDFAQADVTLAIHKGSEALAATVVPMTSVFLVVEQPTGLEVIWKYPFYMMPGFPSTVTPLSDEDRMKGLAAQITRELEKRLRLRHKGKQK